MDVNPPPNSASLTRVRDPDQFMSSKDALDSDSLQSPYHITTSHMNSSDNLKQVDLVSKAILHSESSFTSVTTPSQEDFNSALLLHTKLKNKIEILTQQIETYRQQIHCKQQPPPQTSVPYDIETEIQRIVKQAFQAQAHSLISAP